MKSLYSCKINETVKIKELLHDDKMKQRLYDLGIQRNNKIMPILKCRKKGMIAYRINSFTIALRKETTNKIMVETEGEHAVFKNQCNKR